MKKVCMTKCFRENLVNAQRYISCRILATYVPLRTEQERERVFEEISLVMHTLLR